MRFSRKTLDEVREDRARRDMPMLVFETEACQVPVRFVGGRDTPIWGAAPLRALYPDISKDAVLVLPDEKVMADGYGRLRNLGPGAARDVTVTFTPDTVTHTPRWDATPTHRLWEADPLRLELPNTMRANPAHVTHNETACINDLPDIIVWDIDREVSYVSGIAAVHCRDIAGAPHETTQPFTAIPQYDRNPPHVMITFHKIGSPQVG